jgi:hypothetical protein
VGVGITDLVVYLIDCAMPHQEHFLPKEVQDTVYDYYRSPAFGAILKSIKGKSLDELIGKTNS